ncbi:MAG: hypothetical protein HeimC2_18700 [Candidatus Heimdallarchaeota archaeon LC_2]|nr:MAG: hypothetical protein HeimC2_18700 [Candidatus Heimdallarchaeota archaeon LC_2]
MQQLAFYDYFDHQGFEFYRLKIKKSTNLYFKLFLIWTMWTNRGRVWLQSVFALEFGIYLDSNLVSRMMSDLLINLAPKQRVKSLTFKLNNKKIPQTSRELILHPVAENNLKEFSQLDTQNKADLIEITHRLASGERLSEIQEGKPSLKPFHKLKKFGSKLQDWTINTAVNSFDAVGIAIDEKIIRKAFNLKKHKEFGHHWVSRCKTYLPSIMIEVVGLLRPGRLAEVVGHFFPYPQKNYDVNGKYKPLRKHEFLQPFLEVLFQRFGDLVLVADANYATRKVISWLQSKGWHFVMRLNSNNKMLAGIKEQFEQNVDLKFIVEWMHEEEFGGFIRILAYRRRWKDAKGTRKHKTYYLITTLDWDARSIWRFYRLRWSLENTFKALPVLDRTPGMDADLIRGFLALNLHVIAPICYQSRSSSRTVAKLLNLPMLVKGKKVVWQNIPTRFARRLLLIGYYRSMEFLKIELEI